MNKPPPFDVAEDLSMLPILERAFYRFGRARAAGATSVVVPMVEVREILGDLAKYNVLATADAHRRLADFQEAARINDRIRSAIQADGAPPR